MQPILSEYYGDNTRWFIATVIDASPPYGREGRVKIRIHGLHSDITRDIPQNDLPWAQCVVPTTEGGVSGIGRIPKIQSGALVFGIFMDGMNSQVPIVLGSLPHIEMPTAVQLNRSVDNFGDDTEPKNVFQKTFDFFTSLVSSSDVDDEDTDEPSKSVKENREKAALGFFLNVGYTEKQALALVAGLSRASNMTTGTPGIGNFSDTRYNNLLTFSDNFNLFSTQIQFVLFELNGKKTNANIRLLQSDKIEGTNGTAEIVAKYYLDNKVSADEVESKAKALLERI